MSSIRAFRHGFKLFGSRFLKNRKFYGPFFHTRQQIEAFQRLMHQHGIDPSLVDDNTLQQWQQQFYSAQRLTNMERQQQVVAQAEQEWLENLAE